VSNNLNIFCDAMKAAASAASVAWTTEMASDRANVYTSAPALA
jgi:hypothetical protein